MDKKKYYKNNKNYYRKNNNNKDSKVMDKKLTYDDIVNVRKDAEEIKILNNRDSNISVIKLVSLSIVILAIIFGSLLLFRVI